MIEELSHDEVAAEEGAAVEAKEGEGQQDGAEPVEQPVKKVFNQEKYDQVFDAWWKALRLETATPPFTGDLENPLYVSILAGMVLSLLFIAAFSSPASRKAKSSAAILVSKISTAAGEISSSWRQASSPTEGNEGNG